MTAVSVVITTYNEAEFIAEAIDSMLDQTIEDFELVIVDDGSTDATPDIVRGYDDPRIRLFPEDRLGRSAALNRAIRRAGGEYVAVVDPDDRSKPHRLEVQREYLDAHPAVGIVGSAYEAEHAIRNESYTRRYPTSDAAIRRAMAKFVPIPHSSMMARREALLAAGLYDETREVIVDLDLYIRVADEYDLANVEEPLIRRRIRPDSNFHSLFSDRKRRLALLRLNARAIRELSLPSYCYAYPLAHLAYWQLPDGLKRTVRRRFSELAEHSGG